MKYQKVNPFAASFTLDEESTYLLLRHKALWHELLERLLEALLWHKLG